ncbi:MAG: NADPH:quinone oxidoreductase, partial [Ramlibacter sp.]|nr:NADPH:quinone oxidoreductase [Ramlibacter sp.]
MQAISYARYGPPSVLEVREQALPEPGPGEVRVQLAAAAVAQVDAKLRAGLLRTHFPLTLPKIPGRDGVGRVDKLGLGVNGWSVGEDVCVLAAPLLAGTYASAIVCDAARIVRRPRGLTLQQAAALLQPGASAWAAVACAGLEPGMRVLVH